MSSKLPKHQQPIVRAPSFKKRLRLWWADYQWIVLAIAGLLIFSLGFIGFKQLYAGAAVQRTPFDLVYQALQLFRISSVVPPGPKPWQLEAARTLATVITLIAGANALVLLFREKFQGFRLSRWKDHTVICGLGKKGAQLAEDLIKQGEQVVIIEKDDGSDEIENFRGKGAIVLIGNAASLSILKKAKAAHARYVFVVGGEDKSNLEIALLAHQLKNQDKGGACEVTQPAEGTAASELPGHLPPFRCCFAHLIDLELRDLLAQHQVFSGSVGRVPLKCFNIFENSVRRLFRDYYPDVVARALGQKEVHLLIVGFGRMGQSVALQAARVGHYPHDAAIRMTVVDKHANKRAQLFLHKYPNFRMICDICFVDLDVDDLSFLDGSFLAEHGGGDSITGAIICLEQESAGLICGLHLAKLFGMNKQPLYIRMGAETDLISLLQRAIVQGIENGEPPQTLQPFGTIADCCSSELVINEEQDRMAREIHAGYVRKNLVKDQSLATKPSMRPWSVLAEDLKESNRQQTEHIDTKLRTIGCYRRPLSGTATADFSFTIEEIELLARMEHARWNAERFLSGWDCQEGLPGSDPARKLTPYLVGWEQLSDEIKQYDRNAVMGIPAILAHIGQEIVRGDDKGFLLRKI